MPAAKNRSEANDPSKAVSPRNQRRVEQAALQFMAHSSRYQELPLRFDIMAVGLKGGFLPWGFKHLDNAWEARQ